MFYEVHKKNWVMKSTEIPCVPDYDGLRSKVVKSLSVCDLKFHRSYFKVICVVIRINSVVRNKKELKLMLKTWYDS